MNAAAVCFAMPREREAAEIAHGLRRRDPDLLDRLIEQYQHRLLRYLRSLVGEPQTAEDLFQETWIRVLEHGASYNGRTKFITWLLTIARNLAIDYLRRKRPASLEALTEDEGTAGKFVISSGPSGFELVAHGEQGERIAGALRQLSSEQREAIILRFQEEMSLQEIAQLTAVPLSTVKSRLYRGLEALTPLVEETSS